MMGEFEGDAPADTATAESQPALETLIKRLEQAAAGSRELDAAIVNGINTRPWGIVEWDDGEPYLDISPTLPLVPVQHYTTSIDAALTLVPEGFDVTVHRNPRNIGNHARVSNMGLKHEPVGFVHDNLPAPICVCIAALRARLPR